MYQKNLLYLHDNFNFVLVATLNKNICLPKCTRKSQGKKTFLVLKTKYYTQGAIFSSFPSLRTRF